MWIRLNTETTNAEIGFWFVLRTAFRILIKILIAQFTRRDGKREKKMKFYSIC